MVSKKSIEIVKSTAPVLEEHGEKITEVFYRLLFKNHPELRDVFNMTHQKKGTQQKILASTIFKYALHIDHIEELGDTVESIAQKHTSLSIPKEAYPIVGKYLLEAIKTVLKKAATNEIIDAWNEAYSFLASIFIKREEQIYATRERTIGGYRGQQEYIITKKVEESEVITSFYLERKDGNPVPKFLGGQYIAITIQIPGSNHKHTRNYSLSDASNQNYFRISVKKEIGNPNGIVSNYLHNSIKPGSVVEVGMPSGEFILKNNKQPIVFISGGIGVTPLLAMLKEAAKKNIKDITFIQCALHSKNIAFQREVKELIKDNTKITTIYSTPLHSDKIGVNYDYEGFLSHKIVRSLLTTKNTNFYFCGPTPFMANTLKILNDLEIKNEYINYEFFGPKEALNLSEFTVV